MRYRETYLPNIFRETVCILAFEIISCKNGENQLIKLFSGTRVVYKDIIHLDYFCLSVVFTCEIVSVGSIKRFPDKQGE